MSLAVLRFGLVLLLLASLAGSASTQETAQEPALETGQEAETVVPFYLPTPEGWRTETIPFPLSFAPSLEYEGLEEIRFAPGMFDAEQSDFWTYAFVWWVPKDTVLTKSRLETDLVAYFQGLAEAVAKGREIEIPEPTFSARLEAVEVASGRPGFRGSLETFDAFASLAVVQLNARIEVRECVEEGRLLVTFEISPQAESHAVWKTLAAIREGARCSL